MNVPQTETKALNRGDSGFTMIEMAIVMAILTPVLMVLVTTTTAATRSIDSNDRSADVTEALSRSAQRLAQLLRPGKLSTVKMHANATDVTLLRAAAVGEWIDPVDLEWRDGLQFEAASGLLSMNAQLSTSPREILYVMDSNETDNGVDDDGDGFIDEGQLRLLYDGTELVMADQFEEADFTMDGNLVRMRLQFARQDASGTIHRAALEQAFLMRNN